MADGIKAESLAEAIEQEFTIYNTEIVERLDSLSESTVKKLVKLTKATAPKGNRGSFRKHISSKRLEKTDRGSKYVWYVKPPDHRLTHLLVHGHAKKNGGRTKANPFLENALAEVLPEFEKAVEEAIKE